MSRSRKTLIHLLIAKSRNLGHGAIIFSDDQNIILSLDLLKLPNMEYDHYRKNHPAFMAMELIEGYLDKEQGEKYYETDIYDNTKNDESVKEIDILF